MKKHTHEVRVNKSNPFLTIPSWLKILVFTYFVVFDLVANIVQLSTEPNLEISLFGLVLLRMVNGFLAIFPILFFRKIGIMHLLVFPFFLALAKRLFQSFFSFITPFLGEGVTLQSTSAVRLLREDLIALNVENEFYTFLYLIFLYVGYLTTKRKWNIKLPKVKIIPNRVKFMILSGIVLAITFTFFALQGGVVSWIVQWGAAGGRRAATEAFGPILRLLEVAYFVPLTWYAYRGNKAFKSPTFLLILLATIFLGFFATGSRSSILLAFLSFLVIQSLRNQKLPILRYAAVGGLFFILFGLFGQIRSASTFNQGDFDVDDISFSYDDNFERAVAEANEWAELGADIAIYHHVPEENEFLMGKTYVAFLTFWLPRSIWPDKPHGAGYYTGREIYNGQAGIPPTAVAESYWNFGVFGVILLSLLNGALIRIISDTYVVNSNVPAIRVIYAIILVTGVSMSTLALTSLLQKLLFIVLGYKFLKVL